MYKTGIFRRLVIKFQWTFLLESNQSQQNQSRSSEFRCLILQNCIKKYQLGCVHVT